MNKGIIVLDADQKQCHQLCTLLEARQFRAKPIDSISSLQECLSEGDCLSVFIDIDTIFSLDEIDFLKSASGDENIEMVDKAENKEEK